MDIFGTIFAGLVRSGRDRLQGCAAIRIAAQDRQEAADLEDLFDGSLQAADRERALRLLAAFRPHQEHTQAGTRDIV